MTNGKTRFFFVAVAKRRPRKKSLTREVYRETISALLGSVTAIDIIPVVILSPWAQHFF